MTIWLIRSKGNQQSLSGEQQEKYRRDPEMKLALIQIGARREKEESLRLAEEYIRKAKEESADIAMLPEMFNCPYENANFPVYAEPEGGLSWERMSQVAKKNGITRGSLARSVF